MQDKLRPGALRVARNRRHHFKMRLQERYRLTINREQYEAMNNLVRDGKAQFIGRESNSRTLWVVEHEGKPIYVLYSSQHGGLITALRMEWLPS